MKKLLFMVCCLFTMLAATAQQPAKNDVILKLNGDELNGKVLKINDNDIEFSYTGETLVYNIKKADIMKITYASGRIEVYNKPALPSEAKSQPAGASASKDGPGFADHHNKIAVLPFTFVRDGAAADDAIAEQVQNETFSFMSKHSGVFEVLNPRTTNALLIKAGVTKESIKGYTMDDICNILGVEYVVEGIVNMNKTNQTSYQSSSGTTTKKDDPKDDKSKKTYSDYSSGTTTQNFQTKLSLNMYNDKGATVYAQDRTSFWNTQDAYKSTLEYLLKRSPLYTK
ncbi:hypothetical protein [Paraflavitalea sp. CAU 1676]|uniref:hypothetical protein n=1 Tax=Paraflavitalea sp. CAU 1676 TaxID=3032598 RepID=UPI0023DB0DA2|nr:hypothetical protein [Paraflavitalea sp. CAU 1676]MDF2191481.1 hypothetical protein [Paraflavitalea sp. CAU 1676]